MVRAGDPAPDFTLTSDTGEEVSLSDFRGKPVVLYFYPKDDTLATIASAMGARRTGHSVRVECECVHRW